jgi:WD40 repeat protein
VTHAAFAPEKTTRLPQSPYKGLFPYTEADSYFFFGREVERELIAANLMAARLTVLYGPSGVGKTSVLDAGVAHDLTDLARETVGEDDTPNRTLVIFRTWYDDPVAGLSAAVAESVRALLPDRDFDDPPPGATLVDALAHWAQELDGRLLIVLDQFEEYFVYASPGDRFGKEFPRAVNRSDLRANFVISIREDALAKLDRFKGRIPYLFDNYLRLDRLDVGAARLAIEGPLRRWAELGGGVVSVEEKLVAQVLKEVRPDLGFGQSGTGTAAGERPDRIETTFLQLVMTKLWETERAAGSNVLRASTLKALGGAKGIVRAHLNEGLDLLTAEEKDVAAHIFQFLVTRSGQKVAHTAVDLTDFSGVPLRAVTEVLERLSRRDVWILRRVDPAVGEKETGSLYEIYHDTLGEPILAWRSAHLQRMNERKANKRARDARRRARLWAIGAATMLAVAAACLALLFLALHARSTADTARKVARAQQLVAESEAALPTDPDGALRKAEQALEVKSSPQAELAFRTAVGASQLRVAIRHPRGAILRAAYSGDGKRVMTLGADKSVVVSDARTGRLISRIGYHADLRTADLSRDGRYVVTAGQRDNRVRFWNASTGALLATFHNPELSGAWLDPADGREAVATGFDGDLRIWRLGERKPLDFNPPSEVLTHAAFSPDGKLIAAIGPADETWVFDVRRGKIRRTLGGHIAQVTAVAWSRDSRHLATVGNDGRWRVWDPATGSAVGATTTSAFTDVAFSPDGKRLATVAGSVAEIWDTTTTALLKTLQGHSNVITDLAFRRDGRLLVTGSADGTARVWNLATGTTLTELRGSGSVVESAVFSPRGRFVLTASADRTARIWDVGTGAELWHHAQVRDAVFSPNGKEIVTGGQDQRIVVWDARTGKLRRTLPRPPIKVAVNSIRFSPNGKLLIVATDDSQLLVRRASTGRPIATVTENTAPVFQAVFSPNSKSIALADADGKAGIFDARTGKLRRWLHRRGQEPAHPLGRVNSIGWSPDGRFIVTGGSDSQIHVWNAATGRYLRTLWAHAGPVNSVAFAPDADRVVTTGADRMAYVWTIPSGKPLATLKGDPQPLYSAAFSPNGRRIVTGDSGGVVRVWDWRAQKMLAAIPAHADLVNAVSFSADGNRILSASDDWSAKIYGCGECIPLRELRHHVIEREGLIAPL